MIDGADVGSDFVADASAKKGEIWDSNFLRESCDLELQRVQKINRKRLLPLLQEYMSLLRFCVEGGRLLE